MRRNPIKRKRHGPHVLVLLPWEVPVIVILVTIIVGLLAERGWLPKAVAGYSAVAGMATTLILSLPFLYRLTVLLGSIWPTSRQDVKPRRGVKKKLRTNTRFWEKAGFLFGRQIRLRMYDPAINEIREDYLVARRLCRSNADYHWIKTCFAIRGARAFLRSAWESLLQPMIRMIPGWLRQWWNLFH